MNAKPVLCFDIGGTAIKYAFVKNGTIVERIHEIPTDAKRGGLAILQTIITIADANTGWDGIAISTAGQVDSTQGKIIYANKNLPAYTGMDIRGILQEKFGPIKVVVENDGHAAAYGEKCFGSGIPYQDFLCLTFGTGIGGAFIIDGKLYKGKHYAAGEVGHFTLHKNGLPCGCGQKGCYEQYASVTALVRNAQKVNPAITDGRSVFRNLQNEPIRYVVDSWISEITDGLGVLVNIFDPDCLILGGGIMNEKLVIQQIKKNIDTRLGNTFKGIPILHASLGNSAGVIGAYALYRDAE